MAGTRVEDTAIVISANGRVAIWRRIHSHVSLENFCVKISYSGGASENGRVYGVARAKTVYSTIAVIGHFMRCCLEGLIRTSVGYVVESIV